MSIPHATRTVSPSHDTSVQDAVVFPPGLASDVQRSDALVPDAATSAAPIAQPRYAYVDSLRAFAALLVVWAHAAEVFATLGVGYVGTAGVAGVPVRGLWMNDVTKEFDFGRIGVVVFFAISGFVVPASLKGGRDEGLRRFVVSRVFRLYPAFWLSVPLGALTFYWIWGKPFTLAELLLNLTMLPGPLGAQPALGVYWTLGVELLFYAVCALLFFLGGLRRVRVVMGLATLLFVLALLKRGSSSGMLMIHLSIMFFGTLCRYYLESDRQSPRNRLLGLFLLGYLAAWLLVPLVALGGMALQDWRPERVRTLRTYAIAMGIFCLGLTVLRVRWRVAAWLGEISYSLYLLHPVAMYSGLWLLLRWGPPALYGLHLGVYIAAVVGASTLLSALNYHYLERPMIRLGKRIARRAPANVRRATSESFP